MTPITASIEIARPPEAVFAYIDDLSRHGEWQAQLREVKVETEGPTRVGSRAREKRKVPGGVRERVRSPSTTPRDARAFAASTGRYGSSGPSRSHRWTADHGSASSSTSKGMGSGSFSSRSSAARPVRKCRRTNSG